MNRHDVLALLEAVRAGALAPQSALERLSTMPYEDAGFARIDHHRGLRLGIPEVIYAEGKSPEHVAEIFARTAAAGSDVLATRVSEAAWQAISARVPAAQFHTVARAATLRQPASQPTPAGTVAVLCAGTSDLPVAEEAAVTAEFLGVPVERYFDVGVAGLHRLLAHHESLQRCEVAIVCAGMEGALPSVVGGLVPAPVIAVPTSVGYGAAFSGVAALLGMLNSCSPNVTVVNIDNGFGAAIVATLIARKSARAPIAASSEAEALPEHRWSAPRRLSEPPAPPPHTSPDPHSKHASPSANPSSPPVAIHASTPSSD